MTDAAAAPPCPICRVAHDYACRTSDLYREINRLHKLVNELQWHLTPKRTPDRTQNGGSNG